MLSFAILHYSELILFETSTVIECCIHVLITHRHCFMGWMQILALDFSFYHNSWLEIDFVSFACISSSFGFPLVSCLLGRVITEKEVLRAGSQTRSKMETVIATLVQVALHSEKVELQVYLLTIITFLVIWSSGIKLFLPSIQLVAVYLTADSLLIY